MNSHAAEKTQTVNEEGKMDITHSYIATTRGEYAWRFYLLLSEPMERHRQLSEELLTFARDLGERGVLIRPFDQDVGSTMDQVLGKDWPEVCWSLPAEIRIGSNCREIEMGSFAYETCRDCRLVGRRRPRQQWIDDTCRHSPITYSRSSERFLRTSREKN